MTALALCNSDCRVTVLQSINTVFTGASLRRAAADERPNICCGCVWVCLRVKCMSPYAQTRLSICRRSVRPVRHVAESHCTAAGDRLAAGICRISPEFVQEVGRAAREDERGGMNKTTS